MTGYQERPKAIKADHQKIKRKWQTNKNRKTEKEKKKTGRMAIDCCGQDALVNRARMRYDIVQASNTDHTEYRIANVVTRSEPSKQSRCCVLSTL